MRAVRMLPAQLSYIRVWSERVASSGFAAGVYRSGMKGKEGKGTNHHDGDRHSRSRAGDGIFCVQRRVSAFIAPARIKNLLRATASVDFLARLCGSSRTSPRRRKLYWAGQRHQ